MSKHLPEKDDSTEILKCWQLHECLKAVVPFVVVVPFLLTLYHSGSLCPIMSSGNPMHMRKRSVTHTCSKQHEFDLQYYCI